MASAWLVLAWVAVAGPVAAADEGTPRVAEIRFEGNAVTRDEVLSRELDFVVGDRLTPERLGNSRQAIADLGLFREVDLRHEPGPDGAIVTVRVREKRYLLPIPRVSGNTDRGASLGAQLRWSNVGGLNHTLNAYVETGRPDDRIAEREDRLRVVWNAPYLFNDGYGMAVQFEHLRRDAFGPLGVFDERLDYFELRVLHDHREGRPRSGWVFSAGPSWQRQAAHGPLAPAADGSATALVLTADYSDLRFHLYSETGDTLVTRLEIARDGWLSDYSYSRADVEYRRHLPLTGGQHHNLHLIAAAGWVNGGSTWRNAYSLGGTTRLRGYELDTLEGRSYAYAAAEWLRPVAHDWLRLLVVAEAGATSRSLTPGLDGGPYASVGVGFRVRLPWFVGIELELGVAQPLRRGDGIRFFAGTN